MPPKGRNYRYMTIQEELDCVTGALVGWEISARFLRLRIEQARTRTGLNDLLSPALAELDAMSAKVASAKQQVASTLARLVVE